MCVSTQSLIEFLCFSNFSEWHFSMPWSWLRAEVTTLPPGQQFQAQQNKRCVNLCLVVLGSRGFFFICCSLRDRLSWWSHSPFVLPPFKQCVIQLYLEFWCYLYMLNSFFCKFSYKRMMTHITHCFNLIFATLRKKILLSVTPYLGLYNESLKYSWRKKRKKNLEAPLCSVLLLCSYQ